MFSPFQLYWFSGAFQWVSIISVFLLLTALDWQLTIKEGVVFTHSAETHPGSESRLLYFSKLLHLNVPAWCLRSAEEMLLLISRSFLDCSVNFLMLWLSIWKGPISVCWCVHMPNPHSIVYEQVSFPHKLYFGALNPPPPLWALLSQVASKQPAAAHKHCQMRSRWKWPNTSQNAHTCLRNLFGCVLL